MKAVVVLLTVVALTAAAPQIPELSLKLQFRNLFKEPNHKITTNINPRIIGGGEVEPNSIPFQVFLEMHTNDSAWYCGGSLISESYILTAAHCADGVIEARVYLGRHSLTDHEDTAVYVISNELVVHPEYDAKNIDNDIALVKLAEPVELTDAIQTIGLPSRADANNAFVDRTARVSGWGRTDGFVSGISTVLNAVDVKVISNAECLRDFDILDSVICTSGDEMTGSCNGDSGGPLVVDSIQIGVVSFGISNCLPGYPSAFSRVTSFLDWIEENSNIVIS